MLSLEIFSEVHLLSLLSLSFSILLFLSVGFGITTCMSVRLGLFVVSFIVVNVLFNFWFVLFC